MTLVGCQGRIPVGASTPRVANTQHLLENAMRLLQLLSAYADEKHRFSNRTKREYQNTIVHLNRFLKRKATVADLNDETLKKYIRHRVRTRSGATAKKDRQQLLALWRWAYKTRLTEESPRDIPVVEVERRTVRAWSPAEVAAILKACDNAPTCNDGWGPLHWRALILALYDSGERIAALLRCPIAGYDRERRTLLIPAEVRKRGLADQQATLHDDTVKAIDAMLALRWWRTKTLFGTAVHDDTMRRRLRAILKAAGINHAGHKPFHDIRRTSYTLTFAVFGREVARRQCGHQSDLSRYYLDERLLGEIEPERRIAEAIARPPTEREQTDELHLEDQGGRPNPRERRADQGLLRQQELRTTTG